tara:strand:- start:454 stop:1860 length:1407 start_codon:yes stop_codon:yes gene_type:complete
MTIPKIIHQIWIGTNPCPINMMNTWKDKHPDFEHILWDESEIKKRNMEFKCQKKINEIEQLYGKADIMRLEILYKYGGIYIDADSICIEPIHELLEKYNAFATYENENIRQGLVANGNMAFPKEHQLCKDMIIYIYNNKVSHKDTGKPPWMNTGPLLLTNFLNNKKYEDFTILPSYFFLPRHATGLQYMGHSKIYAYQEWGSTKQNYKIMNNIELNEIYKEPKQWVSVLVSSYNTNHKYVVECLNSIRSQNGHFGIELVWINDGSNELSTKLLEKSLHEYKKMMRFTKIIYKNRENKGLGFTFNEGVEMCNNELIFRMDSDDIMKEDRLIKQINFMNNHNDCVLCGSDVTMFKNIENKMLNCGDTNHKHLLTWDEYKKNPIHWIGNHPTLCFRKSKILELGNYNKNLRSNEDFELQLRILKKYKEIYTLKESLLYYRLHNEQWTACNEFKRPEVVNFRNEFIQKMINE